MITYKHRLSTKQKQDILSALQTGSGVHIKPTKTQLGNVIGTIFASIGISLAVELVRKITGRGAPRLGRNSGKQDGHGAPRLGMYQPPRPFIGTWEQMRSGRTKQRCSRAKQRQGRDKKAFCTCKFVFC